MLSHFLSLTVSSFPIPTNVQVIRNVHFKILHNFSFFPCAPHACRIWLEHWCEIGRKGHENSLWHLKRRWKVYRNVMFGSQTHKRLNKTHVNQTKQDRVQIFEGILFFKATVSCTHPCGRTQTGSSYSFVFVLFVTFKKRISSKICIVLFCLIKKKSVVFNLLCFLFTFFFFWTPAVNYVSDFFFFLVVFGDIHLSFCTSRLCWREHLTFLCGASHR